MNSQQAFTVAKIIVFIYIIISPLLNHKKYIPVMNTQPAKIIIVTMIAIVGFFDLQLSILLSIGLFVMIINFNKDKISISNFTPNQPTNKEKKEKDKPSYIGETIHNFPTNCNITSFEDTKISEDLMSHFIDERTKPYETYIRQLTNENFLIDVQNNVISVNS